METNHCRCCPSLCTSRRQIVLPSPTTSGLIAIGEAPGLEEDRLGYGFAGQAGKTLEKLLGEHGIPSPEFGRANVCRCRPPDNRKPTRQEADACLPLLAEFLLETRPKVLLLVGGTAASYFLGKGSLFEAIEASRIPNGTRLDLLRCHIALTRAADELVPKVIPMPHTSGMAWNRKAPNGEIWRYIGRRQVGLAVDLLR